MGDGSIEWKQLQRIIGLEDRVLELELQVSILVAQNADKVSLSPDGPESTGAVRVSETPGVWDEPSDDDWLTRLAGLETEPEDEAKRLQDERDFQEGPGGDGMMP